MRATASPALMLCLVAISHTASVGAQTARSAPPGNQAVQQLQQLAAERTTLQAQNAGLAKELESLKRELESVRAGRAAIEQRARSSEAVSARGSAEREALQVELDTQKDRMQELVARFRETATTLRTVEADRNRMQQGLTEGKAAATRCLEANAKLVALNDEILDRFDDQGFWSAVARREPFTQLKRVELENLAADYRYQASEQQVQEP